MNEGLIDGSNSGIKINSFKTTHGFKVKLNLLGNIKKADAVEKLKEFIMNVPEKNNIKIITCALMGHGLNMSQEKVEGDWSVY